MKRATNIALAVLVSLLLIAVLWILVRPGTSGALADLVAELKAQGEPVTLAELEAPLPPPERNGASDLDAAEAWFEQNEAAHDLSIVGPWDPSTLDSWEADATPEQIAAVRDLLASVAPLFVHFDAMAEKDEIAWALGPRNSAETVMEYGADIGAVQSLQRFLFARSYAAATPDERLRGLRAMLALGGRTRTLTAIEHLILVMLHKSGSRGVQTALESGDLDPDAARERLDDVLAAEWAVRYPQMVRAERAWVVESMPYWIDGSLSSVVGQKPSIWERFAERIERLFSGGGGMNAPDPLTYIAWAREMGDFVDDTPQEAWERSMTAAGAKNQMAKILGMVAAHMCEADAASGLARLSLAAYEHRRLHGDWPASAADLVPLFPNGVPLDPFTGEAFELAREGDTLVLRAHPWDGYLNSPEEAEEKSLVWRLPPR